MAVVPGPAIAKPFVFLLKPRLSVAVIYLPSSSSTRYSVMGVLPVPPTARFPIQIIGKLNAEDFKIFISYNQLRSHTAAPYNSENGRRRYRKLFSKILVLKCINIVGCNAIIQWYIKGSYIIYFFFCFKKRKSNFNDTGPAFF